MRAINKASSMLPLVALRHRSAVLGTIGGRNHPPRDGMSQVIVHVAAGEYAMICFIPSRPDGTPHFMKGMLRPLVVAPVRSGGHPEPVADARLILNDCSFS